MPWYKVQGRPHLQCCIQLRLPTLQKQEPSQEEALRRVNEDAHKSQERILADKTKMANGK